MGWFDDNAFDGYWPVENTIYRPNYGREIAGSILGVPLGMLGARRNKLFTIRKMKLLGIELPLVLCISKDIYYKAFIDFALYFLSKLASGLIIVLSPFFS